MARTDDRERLAEVRQQDLNEGRLNEDFVGWLKTKGPTWLLIVLAFIVAYLVMVRWQQQEVRARNAAWLELLSTSNPASLEDVARVHAGIDGISDLARLMAADTLLLDLQRGTTLDDDGQARVALDEESRAAHIATAQRLYGEVAADDDQQPDRALATVAALNGLAAIAECDGRISEARDYYNKVQDRARGWMPALADQAAHRAATVELLADPVEFAVAPAKPAAPVTPQLPEGLTILPPGDPQIPAPPLGAPKAAPEEQPAEPESPAAPPSGDAPDRP